MAIIGGLLVTRYITLESELQAAQDRVASALARQADADADVAELEHELRQHEIAGALENDDLIRAVVGAASEGTPIEVSTARGLADLDDFTDDHLAPALDAWVREAKKALDRADLWESIPVATSLDPWSAFRRGRQLSIEIEQVWAGVYNLVAEKREQQAREQKEERDRGLSFSLSIPTTSTRVLVGSRIYDSRERDRLVRLVDDARSMADRQRVETEAAQVARSMISRPPGLFSGLVILALLTAATVVVPMLFLVPTPKTLSYDEGVAIVATFLAAVVLLFGYMVMHVYRLRKLSLDKAAASSE